MLSCLSGARFVEEGAFAAGPEADGQGSLYRDVADGSGSVDTLALVSPRYPICDAVVDGTLVRVDRDHLDGGFVQTRGPEFARRAGLVPASSG